MDESEAGFHRILDYELFAASKEMIAKLKNIAKDQEVPVLDDWIVKTEKDKNVAKEGTGRFKIGSELDFLERNLFRPGNNTYEEATEQILVRQLADPEEEALYAARTISRMVREKGYRYRDIAVISGDLSRYGMRLTRIFREYEIPCFLDDTTGMRSHPLVESIRGIFALFEYDFSYESVCHYVKNGMTDISMEDGDALDNYLLATGLRGFGAFTSA
jgi:ATP-dependent helicase/nuclease subunit B